MKPSEIVIFNSNILDKFKINLNNALFSYKVNNYSLFYKPNDKIVMYICYYNNFNKTFKNICYYNIYKQDKMLIINKLKKYINLDELEINYYNHNKCKTKDREFIPLIGEIFSFVFKYKNIYISLPIDFLLDVYSHLFDQEYISKFWKKYEYLNKSYDEEILNLSNNYKILFNLSGYDFNISIFKDRTISLSINKFNTIFKDYTYFTNKGLKTYCLVEKHILTHLKRIT